MRLIRLLLLMGSISSPASTVQAQTATVAWDASADASVAGYVVMFGTQPGVYTGSNTVDKVTTHTISGLQADTTYYFAVKAYDAAGLVSSISNEVSMTTTAGPAPTPAPTPTATTPTPTPTPTEIESTSVPPANTSAGGSAQNGDAVDGEGITLYFAEGAVNSFFDTTFTLTNPGSVPANVTLTFTDTDGLTSSHTVAVAAGSSERVASRDIAALADKSFATRFDADHLIVAERTVSWPPSSSSSSPSSSSSARHDSFGATTTGTLWAVAEGRAGGPDRAATFLMIANTSDHDGEINVTLTLDDGSKVSRMVPVRAHSRTTVATDGPFAVAEGHRFTALVQSIGGDAPPQIVVERVTYTSADGRSWTTASSSVATRLR